MARSNWHNKPQRKISKLYLLNREKVRRRDQGLCIRCLTITGLMVMATDCDHFIPVSQGGSDQISNLWMLCDQCHFEKSQRESNGLSGFKQSIGLDGWIVEDQDWLAIIEERNKKFESE